MHPHFIASLIENGETSVVDFKQQLELTSNEQKAEFIKDVTSLANSASDVSYLIVGVTDEKQIVGFKGVSEEQLQNIAKVYIDPPVELSFSETEINDVVIGVIQIKPTQKPHKIAREFNKLKQNDVFVRRGTTTDKATPAEIIKMHEELDDLREIRRYIRAAEKHIQLSDFESAKSTYSKAIEILPTAELFVGRAKVNSRLFELCKGISEEDACALRIIDDLTKAEILDKMNKFEKEIRFGRFDAFARTLCTYPDETRDEDKKWLEENLTGVEQGKFYFLTCLCIYNGSGIGEKQLSLLNQAEALGYKEAEFYPIRARAYIKGHNFGFALRDINLFIEMRQKKIDEQYIQALYLKAHLLIWMGSFDQGLGVQQYAVSLSKGYADDRYLGSDFTYGIEPEVIVSRYAFTYTFCTESNISKSQMLEVVRLLVSTNLAFNRDHLKSGMLTRDHPKTIALINKILESSK